ncbi:MAG: DUF3493 domain-containing protein [Cyanobacteriota bacterium]|nr:DUF3493 domain-containing protein [Cyanobacteriota bacterium]
MTAKPSPPSSPDRKADQYARLRAEAKAPYRGLRQVIYATAGASGTIGALIMVSQLIAGADVSKVLPNLLIQIGVLGIVTLLFRLERRR